MNHASSKIRLLVPLLALLVSACQPGGPARRDITVFYAASLNLPMIEMARKFEESRPEYRVILEAGGSRVLARKVSDLGRACDVFISADIRIIDDLLLPEHADWSLPLLTNEMALAYRSDSRRAAEIDESNWLEILSDHEVELARGDPNSAPCGYRTIHALLLAETHYGRDGAAWPILKNSARFVRPRESDLLPLLESGVVDYAFIYRSTAEQHGLAYVRLPDEVNLSDPARAGRYAAVQAEVSGARPGLTTKEPGRAIVYGFTIPRGAAEAEGASAFAQFMLSELGRSVWDANHLNSAAFARAPESENAPATLAQAVFGAESS